MDGASEILAGASPKIPIFMLALAFYAMACSQISQLHVGVSPSWKCIRNKTTSTCIAMSHIVLRGRAAQSPSSGHIPNMQQHLITINKRHRHDIGNVFEDCPIKGFYAIKKFLRSSPFNRLKPTCCAHCIRIMLPCSIWV